SRCDTTSRTRDRRRAFHAVEAQVRPNSRGLAWRSRAGGRRAARGASNARFDIVSAAGRNATDGRVWPATAPCASGRAGGARPVFPGSAGLRSFHRTRALVAAEELLRRQVRTV